MGVEPQQLVNSDSHRRPAPTAEHPSVRSRPARNDPAVAILVEVLGVIAADRYVAVKFARQARTQSRRLLPPSFDGLVVELRQQLRRRQGRLK